MSFIFRTALKVERHDHDESDFDSYSSCDAGSFGSGMLHVAKKLLD